MYRSMYHLSGTRARASIPKTNRLAFLDMFLENLPWKSEMMPRLITRRRLNARNMVSPKRTCASLTGDIRTDSNPMTMQARNEE